MYPNVSLTKELEAFLARVAWVYTVGCDASLGPLFNLNLNLKSKSRILQPIPQPGFPSRLLPSLNQILNGTFAKFLNVEYLE